MHRRENWGQPVLDVITAIEKFLFEHQDWIAVWPVHPNTLIQDMVEARLSGKDRVYLTKPFDYTRMIKELKRSSLILTDSGGIQEEAPSIGVYTLVARKATERPEGVEAGVSILVGTDRNTVYENLMKYAGKFPPKMVNPYGDGKASQRIAEYIKKL